MISSGAKLGEEYKSLSAEQEASLLTKCRNELARISSAFETIEEAKGEAEADSLKEGIDGLRADSKGSAKEKSGKISEYLTRLEEVKSQTQKKYDDWLVIPDPDLKGSRASSVDERRLKNYGEYLNTALEAIKEIMPIMQELKIHYESLAKKASDEAVIADIVKLGTICSLCTDVIWNAFCNHIAKLHNKEISSYFIQDDKEEHMVSKTLFDFNKVLADERSEGGRYQSMEGLARKKLLDLVGDEEKVKELIKGPLKNTIGMSKEAQFFVAMLNAERDSAKLEENLKLVFSGELDPDPKAKTEKGLASGPGKFFQKHLPGVMEAGVSAKKFLSDKKVKIRDKAKKFLSDQNPLKEVTPLAKRRSGPRLGGSN